MLVTCFALLQEARFWAVITLAKQADRGWYLCCSPECAASGKNVPRILHETKDEDKEREFLKKQAKLYGHFM